MEFKHGVHTIEITNPEKKKYKVNIAKLYGEYMTIAETEDCIEYELLENSPCTITRIDYRFDSQDQSYAELFPRMRQLVYTMAYNLEKYKRLQSWHDEAGVFHSVRFHPKKKDRKSHHGVEFYDKPYQIETDKQGKARLEFRRLNLNGETLTDVVNQWRQELAAITRTDYEAMLETHAQELLKKHYTHGERIGDFVVRTQSLIIGREEGKMFYHLNQSRQTHQTTRAARVCKALPSWYDLQITIQALSDMLTS